MKTALLVGGGLVALLVVYKLASSSALTVPAGTVGNTALVPGSSGGGTGTSIRSKLNSVGVPTSAKGVASSALATLVVGPSYEIYKGAGALIHLL